MYKIKRVLLISVTIFILASFMSLTGLANESEFEAIEIAEELMDMGLLQGDNGDLMLDKHLKREEMCVVVSRLLGAEDLAINFPVDKMTFTDVPKDNWAAPYISWAQANRIIEGYSPEVFGLGDSLTTWQTKAFFVRTLGYTYVLDEGINDNAEKLGLLHKANLDEDAKPILRRDMAVLMHNSLYAKCSDGKTFEEKLQLMDFHSEESKEVLKIGNSVGNLVNQGLYALQGEWIYFSNSEDDDKLYKMKLDGSDKIKISDDKASYINVMDDWVYYINLSDENGIYKIKTDGTQRSILSDETHFSDNLVVVNDTIYYISLEENEVVKMKLDGTGIEFINYTPSQNLVVTNNAIFLSNLYDKKNVYKMDIDSKKSMSLNKGPSHYINVVEGWIYFADGSDNMSLYKMDIFGGTKTKLCSDQIGQINVYSGWIYYVNHSDGDKPYRIDVNGMNMEKLSDKRVSKIFVINGQTYFK